MKTVPFNAEQAKAGRPVIHAVLQYPEPMEVVYSNGSHAWIHCPRLHEVVPTDQLCHPANPASGHNPAQLDEWQVGVHEGQRTLAREEALCRRAEFCDGLEVWNASAKEWFPAVCGINEHYTYRTKRPAGYFLPKVVTRNIRQDELPDMFIVTDPNRNNDRPEVVRNYTSRDIKTAATLGWLWSRSLDGPRRPFTVEDKT